MSLATDHRPTTLDSYLGSNVVSLLSSGKIHELKAIFISGPTGCGKTTAARLLAKQYLVHAPEISAMYSSVDEYEAAFDEYIISGDATNIPGVYETDIATDSTKDRLETTLAEIHVAPSMSVPRKVFIFDEIHVASESAQSRLLKTVEEPPANVLMIFATTNPSKVIPTLRNRCEYKIHINKPSMTELTKLLATIATKEGYSYETKALRSIAIASKFLIRESISLLEQTALTYGDVKIESANAVIGKVSDQLIWDFMNAYADKNAAKGVRVLGEVRLTSDARSFLDAFTDFVNLGIYTINGVSVPEVSDDEVSKYRKLFGKFTVQELALLAAEINKIHSSTYSVEANLLNFIYSRSLVETDRDVKMDEASEQRESFDKLDTQRVSAGEENVTSLTQQTTLLDSLSKFNPVKLEG